MALYLCSRFRIFYGLILGEYVYQVKGGPHLLQSCLRVTQDGMFFATKEMHIFFESLVVTGTPGVHDSLMDIHHDTSLRFILEDDSISSTIPSSHLFLFKQGGRVMVDY